MNLHHKALRHFISASVIVLTSSFLIYELIASDRAMNAYMRYIMERADSSFLYDKYQNQSIAAHLMRTFEAPGEPVTTEKRRAFCDAFETINGTQTGSLPCWRKRLKHRFVKAIMLFVSAAMSSVSFLSITLRIWLSICQSASFVTCKLSHRISQFIFPPGFIICSPMTQLMMPTRLPTRSSI